MFAFSNTVRKAIARALLGFALLLAACGDIPLSSGGGTGPRIDPSQPVQVALLVPQSDPSGGAILARSAENAARLAARDLTGVAIDLRVYDTAGNEARAAQVAQQAVNDGAKIIVGPIRSQTTVAVRSQLAASGANINILSLSNNSAVAGGNTFVLGSTFENIARRLVRFAAAQGKKRVYIVHGNDLAETQGRDAIIAAVQESRTALAGSGGFDLSQKGVSQALPGIASQARAASADVVFLTSGTVGALPLVVELLPENGLGPDVAQYVGLQRFDIPSNAPELRGLQGSWFALPDTQFLNQFSSRYRTTFGDDPHPIVAAPAYDAIAAIGALVATGDRSALTTGSLTRGQGFVGAGGVFRLRSDGNNDRALAVAQIQNNKVVVIDPAPRSFGGAGF